MDPLERFRYPPMPLEWSGNAAARRASRKPDPEHRLPASVSGKHLAGRTGHRSKAQLFAWLVGGTRIEVERNWLGKVLQDIREEDYPQSRRRDAMGAWQLARAVLECDVRRGALSRWLTQFAERPVGRKGEVKGWPIQASEIRLDHQQPRRLFHCPLVLIGQPWGARAANATTATIAAAIPILMPRCHVSGRFIRRTVTPAHSHAT